jgi:hypothetical protein
MAKLIAYLLMFAFLGAVSLWLFWHVISAAYWFGWMLFWLGLLAMVGYIAFSLIKPKFPSIAIKKKVQYKLADLNRDTVYAFRLEPSLKDIVLLNDELHLTKLELQGDVLQLNSDTVIKIVEDTGKEAVKVEIKGTKSKEKIVWVPRSSIVKS